LNLSSHKRLNVLIYPTATQIDGGVGRWSERTVQGQAAYPIVAFQDDYGALTIGERAGSTYSSYPCAHHDHVIASIWHVPLHFSCGGSACDTIDTASPRVVSADPCMDDAVLVYMT
jgi:hypothetical protein